MAKSINGRQALPAFGISIAAGAVILFLISVPCIYWMPEKSASAIDRTNVKVFLGATSLSLLCVFGISVFRVFYLPHPKRFVFTTGNMLLVAALFHATTPLLIFAVDSARIKLDLRGQDPQHEAENRFSAEVTMNATTASASAVAMLGIAALSGYGFAREYTRLSIYEKENGPLA